MHKTPTEKNIQQELKENSAEDTIVTNNKLEIKENSAQNTNVTNS